jgi:hypothetical protein
MVNISRVDGKADDKQMKINFSPSSRLTENLGLMVYLCSWNDKMKNR